jgi:hypothetical protein
VERVEITVDYLVWDSYNTAKIEAHGLTQEEVEAVANNAPRFFTNLAGRSAGYVMVGPDMSDRFIFAPMIPVSDDRDWYVVTAFRMARQRALRIYNRG